MTVFFFNTTYEGVHTVTGVDLRDADAAWQEAVIATGDWFKETSAQFQPGQSWEIGVTDEQERPLYLFRVAGEKGSILRSALFRGD